MVGAKIKRVTKHIRDWEDTLVKIRSGENKYESEESAQFMIDFWKGILETLIKEREDYKNYIKLLRRRE